MARTLRVSVGLAAAGLAALLVLPWLFAQQDARPGWTDAPQPGQTRDGILTLHTGTQLVVQDITVTDANGHPVTGLKLEDFHIFEDGKPQTIKNFEEHAPINPALAEERAAELARKLPPNTFTNYKAFSGGTVVVFVLDTVDTGICAQQRLRQYMIDYMKTVPEGTPFIIFQLDVGLHMLQDMTTDRDALRTWVQGKRDQVELPPQIGSDDERYPTWPIAARRREIVSGATKELKRYLGAIPGRKNLIWFGSLGGLAMIEPASIDAGMTPTDMSIDPLTLEPVYSNRNIPPGMELIKNAALPPTELKTHPTLNTFLRDMTDSLAQSRVVMHTMGVPCSYAFGVPEHIAALVDQGAHYYTVYYTPTNTVWNGQPRRFNVQLADATYHLQFRRSYSGAADDKAVAHVAAPVETAAAAAVLRDATGPSPTLQVAMGMGTVEPTQIVFEASATPARDESKDAGSQPADTGNFLSVKLRKQGYRDYVVHFRVRANELKLTPAPATAGGIGRMDFVAVLYDNQGQAVNSKREKVSINFDDLTAAQMETAELTGDLTIQVPAKGIYFLRLGVRDAATDRVGALEIPVDRIVAAGK